jgi:hypothetical protein
LDVEHPPVGNLSRDPLNPPPPVVVEPRQEHDMNAFPQLMLVAAAVVGWLAHGPTVTAQEQGGVSVTVQYKGKGTVDASHRLWVWLFDNPNIGPDSIPIGEQSVDTNGGTVTFPSVSATRVYVAVAYDERGGFVGQAPPPAGSPVALYGQTGPDAQPQPVSPGANGKVTISFTDAVRMP